jgi:radical SAM protein with 4Fe4S-binding SPASM domain
MRRLSRAFAKRVIGKLDQFSRNRSPEKYFARKYFSLIRKERDFDVKRHPHITVEASSLCNLNCLCCGTKDATRPRGFIDVEFFEEVIKKVVIQNRQNIITLNTIGETLMHPKFESLLRILDKYSIHLILVTNGLLLRTHAKAIERYSHIIPQIQLSIDGATAQTYEKLRRNGKFDELLKNLAFMKELNRRLKRKISLEINAVLSEDNIDELPEFFNVFSEFVDEKSIFFWPLNSRMSDRTDESYFSSKRLLVDVEPILKSPCSLPFIKSHILYNGDVGACCRDYHGELIVGNINEMDFLAIWNGSNYQEIRHLLRENRHNKLPLCKRCYQFPIEITHSVNIFIQYLLTVKGSSGLAVISDSLRDFLSDLSDVHKAGDLNEKSFERILFAHRQ